MPPISNINIATYPNITRLFNFFLRITWRQPRLAW